MHSRKPFPSLLIFLLLLLLPALAFAVPEAVENIQLTVDFAYIETIAPGSVGWIYQPHSTINQPLMYSSNDKYFLTRRYTGTSHRNGAIFVTGETAPDFSAPTITLYGNNCRDDSLFGSLSLYTEQSYYEQNPTIYLITPQGDYRLDIFAGVKINRKDPSWQVEAPSTQQLQTILSQSFFTPNPDYLPQADDQWAMLATVPAKDQVNRFVLYARKRSIRYENATVYDMNRQQMDLRQTLNGRVTVEGVGSWMVYAQDDPLWDRLIFEASNSPKRRVFGDGGCGPTAVAIALASVLEPEELVRIGDLAATDGYRFCSCSTTENFCNGLHLSYQLSTPEQYLRYFPIAVANFSTGNNTLGVKGRSSNYGTNMSYLEPLCRALNVSCVRTNSMRKALEFLSIGGDRMVVTCTAGADSPFTDTSHFLVMAGVDEEYLYLIDPMRRDDYSRWDTREVLEIVAPGVVRVKLKNVGACNLGPYFQIKRPDPAAMPKPGSTLTYKQ